MEGAGLGAIAVMVSTQQPCYLYVIDVLTHPVDLGWCRDEPRKSILATCVRLFDSLSGLQECTACTLLHRAEWKIAVGYGSIALVHTNRGG